MRVLITDCNDSMTWYADQIGKTFDFISEESDCIRTKEPAGYVNFVPKNCCKVIESDDEIEFEITFELLLKKVIIGSSVYRVVAEPEGFYIVVSTNKFGSPNPLDRKEHALFLHFTYEEAKNYWSDNKSQIYYWFSDHGHNIPKWLFKQ